jgi:hypothetical protein
MKFYLTHKYGPETEPKLRKIEFSTEPEAVIRACTLIASGAAGDIFEVMDEAEHVITDDQAIRSRCKQSGDALN